MAELLELAKAYGPWVALCAYFVWQSWLRENRIAEQLYKTETFIRESMMSVIRDNTEAMRGLKDLLKSRPCLINDGDVIDHSGNKT